MTAYIIPFLAAIGATTIAFCVLYAAHRFVVRREERKEETQR